MALVDFSLPASDPNNPNGVTSASDLQRRLLAAQLMQKNGSDTSPIQSPWQGAARMVQAALGGWDEGQLNKQAAAGAKANSDALAAALGGIGGGSVTATPAAAPAASADAGADGGALPSLADGQIKGMLSIGGNQYAFGSGGVPGHPHIPFGDYPVTPDAIGPWGQAHGALGINNGVIPDAELGRDRTGIELHAGSSDKLITEGCLAIAGSQWPQLKQQITSMISQNGPVTLHVGPEGATIAPKNGAPAQTFQTAPNAAYGASAYSASAPQSGAQGALAAALNPNGGSPVQVASLGSLSGIGGGGAALPATAPLPPPRPANLGAAPAPTQVASNDSEDDATPIAGGQVAALPPSAAPQPQAAPTAPARPAIDTQKLLAVISSPYSTPAQQQIATALLQSAMKPKDPIHVGDSLVDPTTYKTLYSAPAKADATPTSVREYEYGLAHPDYVKQQQILNQKAEGNHVVSPGAVLLDPKGNVIYKNQGADMSAPETQNTVDFLARRVLAGDPQALTNIGRGAQGGEMVRAVQGRVAELAKEGNIDPKTILGNQADFSGQKAEQRTLGTQNARVTSAATEAKGAAQMAIQALDNLPRSNVVPANKLWQMGESALSDPNLKSAQLALMTLKNTYARAINPNGTPHMGDKEHFDQLMSTADGPEATHAAIGQILREVEMAQQSPAKAMKILQNIRAGKAALDGVEEGFGSSTAAPTAAPQVNVPGSGATHIWTPTGGLQKVAP